MRTSILIIICIAAGLLFGGVILFLFPESLGLQSTLNQKVRTSGKALINGSFSLTDHKGSKVSEQTYKGKFTLIYFGYTFCPDVCPTELQVMSSALDILGRQADKIQPVFITVDPKRDTVAVMADYISNFHSSFVGLTGTQDDIKSVTKNFRIYFAKAENKDSPEDYLMDHSSIIYLMNGNGEFLKHFSFGVKPEDLAKEVRKIL